MITVPMAGRYTSFFGPRDGELHDGVDIAAPAGTRIFAAWPGTVRKSEFHDGWGWQVVIDHGKVLPGQNVMTRYAHMIEKPLVSVGQRVEANEWIGREGSTGHSTGPHLHFGMYFGTEANYSTARDPYPYLKGAQMVIHGVDVSRHNGDAINWGQMAKGGIQFATIKASEGTKASGETSAETVAHFRRHLPLARAQLPLVGGYHVLRSMDVKAQVSWFLEQLSSVGDPRKMMHQLDYEKWTDAQGRVYDFPAYSLVKAFAAEHRRQTGGHPLILYCGKWIWDQVPGRPANAKADTGIDVLWNSHYVDGPANYTTLWASVPTSWWTGYGGWAQADLLQYSSTARVPGFAGNIDVNAYRGNISQLIELTTGMESWDIMATLNDEEKAALMLGVARIGDFYTMKAGAVVGFLNRLDDKVDAAIAKLGQVGNNSDVLVDLQGVKSTLAEMKAQGEDTGSTVHQIFDKVNNLMVGLSPEDREAIINGLKTGVSLSMSGTWTTEGSTT